MRFWGASAILPAIRTPTPTERRRLVYSTERPVCARCGWPSDDCHCSVPAPKTAASPPGRVTAKLRVEKRRSGKIVTVVEGMPGGPADLETLLREWKRACGTGGTLHVHEGTIELQGDQRERLRPILSKNGWTVKG